MDEYSMTRLKRNNDPKRKPYDLTSNSCLHFVKEVTSKGGVNNPWGVDPRPNSYIGEFRDDYPDLDYSSDVLSIEGEGVF